MNWYYLWFSEKENMINRDCNGLRRFFITKSGDMIEATCGIQFYDGKKPHFDDYKFVGYGAFHHVEHY